MSIDVGSVRRLNDVNNERIINDFIHDSIRALTDSVVVTASKLFCAEWSRVFRERIYLPQNFPDIFLREVSEVFRNRILELNSIFCHVS